MDDIIKIIEFILKEYSLMNNKWKKYNNRIINLRKKQIDDIFSNQNLLDNVYDYQSFLNDNSFDVSKRLEELEIKSEKKMRIKTLNSIQDKIERYKKKLDGKVSINKCLNDIMGMRITTNQFYKFEEIETIIKDNFPMLKCINSDKGNYRGTHIYFRNDDNFKYPWELQIWFKGNEAINTKSHAEHKQKYVSWEKNDRQEENI